MIPNRKGHKDSNPRPNGAALPHLILVIKERPVHIEVDEVAAHAEGRLEGAFDITHCPVGLAGKGVGCTATRYRQIDVNRQGAAAVTGLAVHKR